MTLHEFFATTGVSQRELARAAGVSVTTMSKIARGASVPRVKVARRLSAATGHRVSVVALMGLTKNDLATRKTA